MKTSEIDERGGRHARAHDRAAVTYGYVELTDGDWWLNAPPIGYRARQSSPNLDDSSQIYPSDGLSGNLARTDDRDGVPDDLVFGGDSCVLHRAACGRD